MVNHPAGRIDRTVRAVAVGCALLLVGLPVAAQEEGGTVTAEVTIAEADEACLLLSVDSVDFGVLDFDDTSTSDPYQVTSCSTADQELFASSTDAAADVSDVVWGLVDGDGVRGIDEFSVDAALDGVGTTWLDLEARPVGTLGGEVAAPATHQLLMPPEGSTGAGQTLSFDIVWTAAVAAGAPVWSEQDSGVDAPLNAVYFVDEEHGWAVGSNGTIVHTADGSESWLPQDSGVTVTLWDVEFVDTSNGWVVGNSGTLRRTVDGGTTWTPQTSGFSGFLAGITFADAQRGWIVGQSGTILATSNGGQSWAAQSSGTTLALADVTFVDADHGWAVGAGVIQATTNGGATWVGQEPAIISIQSVSFVDTQRGWAKNNSSDLITTTDGGQTWDLAPAVDGSAVQFLDAQRGWLAGPRILATIDGGDTWDVQVGFEELLNLNDIHMLSSERGWVVGFQGQIYTYR